MGGKLKIRSRLPHAQAFHPEPRRPVGDNPGSELTEDSVLIQKDNAVYAVVTTARDCELFQTGILGAE